MTGYLIPSGPGEAEFTEKRSRFLGHVRPVESEEEARAFIAQMKKQYYDARHNCWCYVLKDGPERYSDDGEPQGSAGLPMLEVFRKAGVYNAVCVVTRYFGGVLLGTGGLLRAYTKSAKDALDAAGLSVVRPWVRAELCCAYSLAERLKLEVAAAQGAVEDMEYSADVLIKALVPEEGLEAFSKRVTEVTGGAVAVRPVGTVFKAASIK